MTSRFSRSLEAWLALERSEATDRERDLALARAFHDLPRMAPSALLLARVIAEVGKPQDLFSRRWVRLVVAASVVLLTFALTLLPVSLVVLMETVGLAFLVEAASRVLLFLSDGIVRSLTIWRSIIEWSELAVSLTGTPVGWALWGGSMAFLVAAFLFLKAVDRPTETTS